VQLHPSSKPTFYVSNMGAPIPRVSAGRSSATSSNDWFAYLRIAGEVRWWLIAGLLAVAVAWPAAAWAQAGVSGRIAMLNVPTHGQFVRIELDKPTINPANCQAAEFYIVELSGPNANRFLGALYAAHASRATVHFWVLGCTVAQHWGATRPSVYDVYWYMQ